MAASHFGNSSASWLGQLYFHFVPRSRGCVINITSNCQFTSLLMSHTPTPPHPHTHTHPQRWDAARRASWLPCPVRENKLNYAVLYVWTWPRTERFLPKVSMMLTLSGAPGKSLHSSELFSILPCSYFFFFLGSLLESLFILFWLEGTMEQIAFQTNLIMIILV